LEDIQGVEYGTGYKNIIADNLLDIKLQPTDGCVKYIETYINNKSTVTPKNRTYISTGINLQALIDNQIN
jgi:hypothetical protein